VILNIGERVGVKKSRKELYALCVERYGEANALEKVNEEILELALEISRYDDWRSEQGKLVDEMADVLITIEKYIELYDLEDSLRRKIQSKLHRLEKRLRPVSEKQKERINELCEKQADKSGAKIFGDNYFFTHAQKEIINELCERQADKLWATQLIREADKLPDKI